MALTTTKLFRYFVLACFLPIGEAPAGDPVTDALFAVCSRHNERLFDSHGNACRELRTLVYLRTDATQAICKKITELDVETDSTVIAGLYWALGFVKDSSTIGWIGDQHNSSHRRFILGTWLYCWYRPGMIALGPELHLAQKWITEEEKWGQFLLNGVKTGDDESRKPFLMALLARCHDNATLAAVRDLEQTAIDLDAEAELALRTYLWLHGSGYDDVAVAGLIEDLDGSLGMRGGRAIWQAHARVLRDDVFVPKCMELVSRNPSSSELLELISGSAHPRSPRQWRRWYERHGADGRAAWLKKAVTTCKAELKAQPANAEAIVSRHRWLASPMCLPALAEIAEADQAPNGVVLALANMYSPPLRASISKVVDIVVSRSRNKLNRGSLSILTNLEMLPGTEPVRWDTYVDTVNSTR